MSLDVSLGAAFAAGLLSFLSPCILPLVPPFLCYMAGVSAADLTGDGAGGAVNRGRILVSALAFVAGFSAVFVGLGATASVFGRFVTAHLSLLGVVAGIVIVLMGFHFLGLLRIPVLYRSARVEVARKPAGVVGAFVMGLAFAFGWTPCIGPILAAILAVAASEQTVSKGASLLAVYSLGLGIPFVAAALAIEPFAAFMARFKKHMHRVEQAMGGLLVLTGIAFLTGSINLLSIWLLETFPVLGKIG